ncbi:MAG: DUF2469 family protein [Rothia sp. (in: high G+C Gram-positive bacteria)]|nr:DUF2469 family protein [Rothia sp. (in: high G+C Gram-positive bacteria)]
MSSEELENFEAKAQLELYDEYRNVAQLFTYIVETDRRFYLANSVEVTPQVGQGTVYFDVVMNDVWVWDIFRASRFVKSVHVYSFKDVNVEELASQADFVVPEM